MEIINNEFDIPESNPLNNLEAFMMISNAQYFLDKYYQEATKSKLLKIGSLILKELKSARFYPPVGWIFKSNL